MCYVWQTIFRQCVSDRQEISTVTTITPYNVTSPVYSVNSTDVSAVTREFTKISLLTVAANSSRHPCTAPHSYVAETTLAGLWHVVYWTCQALTWSVLWQNTHTHITILRLFFLDYPPPRVSRCQKTSTGLYGAKEDNKSRHTDNPARRHSMQTNQRPTSLIPPFLFRMPFLLQPSQFILAWDRHQVCWLAYPVAWWLWQNIWQIFAAISVGCPLLCVVVDSSLWGVRLQQWTRDFDLHIAMFSCQLFCDLVNLYANTDIRSENYFCRLTFILTAYFWLNLG